MSRIEDLFKKYENELKILGQVELPKDCFWPPEPYRNSPITARENYLRILKRERPMFMAKDLDEFMLSPKIFPDSISRGFVVDAEGLPESGPGGPDMFGVDWVYVEQVGGSMVRPGSPKVPDIEHWEDYISFPDIDTWDWEGSAEKNKHLITKQYATNCWIMTGLFERLISLMDFEEAAMALLDEEAQVGVHRFFDKLCDWYDGLIEHIHRYYGVDIIYFHDDWGSQMSSFFSLSTCREMLVPYLKRVVDTTHKYGMVFNFHSCGNSGKVLVPAMIEAGVDSWCPQPMNDFDYIYENYGDKIAVGVTYNPPTAEASLDEVVESVQAFLDKYTRKGIAYPVIYEVNPHPQFSDVLYVLSREMFAE